MAKRKRKKKSVATSLKYEVYGILLITISVIALSGEATVGRALSKLFGLILGKFYFVLALVGIAVGLAVMVKRAWPRNWSNRKSGLVLLVCALTLMSAIAEIDLKLGAMDELEVSSRTILLQLGTDIRSELLGTESTSSGMMAKAISGGYLGALQYSVLYMLFGLVGSKFILIVMFAIALMLITGKSYVELGRTLRKRGTRMLVLLRHKLASSRKPVASAVKSASSSGSAGKSGNALDKEDHQDFDYDDVSDQDAEPAAAPQKPHFFAWLQEKTKRANGRDPAVAPNSEQEAQDEHLESSVYYGEPEPSGENALYDRQDEPADPSAGTAYSEELSAWPENGGASGLSDETPEQAYDEQMGAGEPSSLVREEPRDPASDSPALESGEPSGLDDVQAGTPDQAPLPKPYRLPSLALLAKPQGGGRSGGTDAADARRKLEATLESFGVRAKVLDVVQGPAVTRYEVQPASGVKVSRIVGLTDDIALALAAKDIRMEAPIPGKSAIGIEVPNIEVSMVTMREVMETTAFQHAPSKLSIAFGRDISGQPIVGNLARMPHLLVAGATGSGKSVCINGIITSVLYKATPEEVRFLMIDPKMVELNVYNGIPHLLAPVVTDPRRASLALKKIVVEMEKRYELFSKSGTRNIEGYNGLMKDNPAAVLPYIVVIVDELADLMMVAAGDVEDAITRLAQMARAAGIHLIIATQRPSVDVITGVIKANIPSRIAFGVSSQVDSRTILDMVGAEKLLGRGDMLFLPVGMSKPIRVQGAFLSDQEVESVVEFTRSQADADYKEDLVPEVDDMAAAPQDDVDELFDQAVQIVLEAKQASVSLLQRRMRVGYTRAARLIDQMEARSIVGPYEGSKPREVLTTLEQYQAGKIPS
ncbi:DNA translocase FtsK [Paenibacillus sp. IB182496]|uniref:DNA translocase FtsK n=1 Tax=Paenibacillus sabuli TaxID=2772509 RepID=A0A927BSQ8_9BACL|nr:DNA translocase FtsK [Paenibacillus sabuli]MBD2845226.1 DNA translocase FtsK [Paenibacillus sabuli]